MPARCAATAWPRSSPSCFRSTAPRAPAPPAMAWASQEFFDPRAWSLSASVAGRWRHPWLGPAQCLLLPDDPRRWPRTSNSTSKCRGTNCRRKHSRSCCTAAATRRSSSRYMRRAVAPPSARIPSRASSRTSSAAIAKPSPLTVREELGKYRGTRRCPECDGTRLNRTARNVFVGHARLPEIARLTVADAMQHVRARSASPAGAARSPTRIVKEVGDRLRFLVDVGLDYLTLDRSAESLSGGEAQRIRLASQVGSGLTGVLYILDEPSIGLHQRDNQRLLATLKRLRDLGNTVLVVEHDEEAIRAADYVLDLGPGAGVHGGEVVAQGTPADSRSRPRDSLTGDYLSGRKKIALPTCARRAIRKRHRAHQGARGNNLKNVSADFRWAVHLRHRRDPARASPRWSTTRCCTASPSQAERHGHATAPSVEVEGLEQIDRVIDIDQSPIGRTPRSNPATYTGLFARCASCSPRCRKRARAATTPAASASTSRAAAARPARATASSRSRCTSCPTCTCPAMCARGSATTARRSRSATAARTSTKCWR